MIKKEVYIDNSSYEFINVFLAILQHDEARKIVLHFLNKITGLKLKEITFQSIEKFQGIIEYDFYLINLIGRTENGLDEPIFIKTIQKGKIKESLFCICDLAYEKYFNQSKEKYNGLKKISIFEEKENMKYINQVSVKLFENNFNREKANLKIYFVEISKMIEQNANKKITWKGMERYIELNPKDIIIVGVENNH